MHNLYRNTLAYTGDRPWHGLGVAFDRPFTSAEALQAAQLDYPVRKEQLYRHLPKDGPEPFEPIDAWATVNGDTNQVLGIVGEQYEVLQNREAFDFFDILLKESGGKLQTAGAIGRGEKVWMLAKLPEVFYPLAGDSVEQYILGTTSHDGSLKTEVRFTGIRTVCENTLNMALKEARSVVSIRHTANMRQKLDMAAMVLLHYKQFFSVAADHYGQLAQVRIDDAWLEAYLEAMLGDPTKVADGRARTLMENRTQLVRNRLTTGRGVDLDGVAGTAWWALNAMVEYADYDMKARGQALDPSRRTSSILFGAAADFKQRAFETAMALSC